MKVEVPVRQRTGLTLPGFIANDVELIDSLVLGFCHAPRRAIGIGQPPGRRELKSFFLLITVSDHLPGSIPL